MAETVPYNFELPGDFDESKIIDRCHIETVRLNQHLRSYGVSTIRIARIDKDGTKGINTCNYMKGEVRQKIRVMLNLVPQDLNTPLENIKYVLNKIESDTNPLNK